MRKARPRSSTSRSATGAGARAISSTPRVLWATGLHWASRQHFLTGIIGYLASPLWLAQLARRHRARLPGELFPARIFHQRIHAVPVVAALRRRALAAAVRAHHGHSARAEIPGPHRRHSRCRDAPRLRRRRHAGDLDAVRNRAVGAARADHDADPDRACAAHSVRPRHRLGSAAARRRLGPFRASCAGTARMWRWAS